MRDRAVRRLLVLADASAIALALLITFSGQPDMWSYVGWGLIVVPVCLVIFLLLRRALGSRYDVLVCRREMN